jgi:hypothetical protein
MRDAFLAAATAICLGGFVWVFLLLRAAWRRRFVRLPLGPVHRDQTPAGFWIAMAFGAFFALSLLRGAITFTSFLISGR